MRRQATMLAAALLSLAVVGGGVTAAPAVANGGSGPGWTATPVAPVTSVWIPGVHVLARAPAWAFDHDSSRPRIPVSWGPYNRTLPAGTQIEYDVQWRYGSTFDQLGWESAWMPFLTATTATSAVFEQTTTTGPYKVVNGDAVEFQVRTVDPATGETGAWSAPAVSNIPLDDNWHHQTWEASLPFGDSRFQHSWTTHSYAGDYYGTEHTTTAATFVTGGLGINRGPRLVIFGMKCANCGKFTIDMQAGRGGDMFVKPILVDTHASTTVHRVVLCSIPIPDDEMWNWQIDTLATQGRPRVSIDGWGVTHVT